MLDLEPIKRRAEAATEGPWVLGPFSGGVKLYRAAGTRPIVLDAVRDGMQQATLRLRDHDRCVMVKCDRNGPTYQVEHPDAKFIAHAREDVPALVAEVEAERAENRRLRAALKESERSVAEWRKYAEDSGNRVAELVHAHYAERADVDAYRIGGGSESWNKRRHDYCLPMPGGTERDNRCNVCKGVDARRAAEANPSAKIGNVVAQAVSAERERCARIVEAYTNTDPDRAIAAAAAEIRRGK